MSMGTSTAPVSERRALRAAYSPLTAAHVAGPMQSGIVLATYTKGIYIGLSGAAAVLPVVASDALALPTALRLGMRSDEISWGTDIGSVVPVGNGRVELPGFDVRAVRQWRPAQVRRPVPEGDGVHPRRALRKRWRDLDRALADRITDAMRDPRQVRHLLGRGYGLTPSCDDALSGALLVAHGLRLEPTLAAAVRKHVHRTTSLSGSFLLAAIDGYATPPVAAFVSAALAGEARASEALLPAVLAIGHSSGRDIVSGVLGALRTLPTDLTLPDEGANRP